MEIEVKSKNYYSKTKYMKAGKVGDLAFRIDEVIEWLKNKSIHADVSRYSRYKQYIWDYSADSDKNKDKILLIPELEAMYEKSEESIRISNNIPTVSLRSQIPI